MSWNQINDRNCVGFENFLLGLARDSTSKTTSHFANKLKCNKNSYLRITNCASISKMNITRENSLKKAEILRCYLNKSQYIQHTLTFKLMIFANASNFSDMYLLCRCMMLKMKNPIAARIPSAAQTHIEAYSDSGITTSFDITYVESRGT